MNACDRWEEIIRKGYPLQMLYNLNTPEEHKTARERTMERRVELKGKARNHEHGGKFVTDLLKAI